MPVAQKYIKKHLDKGKIMKICVFTLGCKVNFYESDGLIAELKSLGHTVTNELSFADIYILNTCCVTNEGERKSRQLVTRVRKFNSNAKIIVCGCASERNAKQFEEKGVNIIFGNGYKKEIINLINSENQTYIKKIPLEYNEEFLSTKTRVRANLKVQDGCNNFCSYCIIPYVRGRSRSRSLENIKKEAEIISSEANEIVLVGINLSDFKPSLIELIESLKDIKSRIRLGSLEVNVINDEFLTRLKKVENFCPQFHLSMQSGSNNVLKNMNRHYTKEEYLEKIDLIKKYYPLASITTDVIVGFPTESDEDFLETVQTIKKAKFFNMHIFPYSKREGTRASKLPLIDSEIVSGRVKKLEEINKQLNAEYIKRVIYENILQNLLIEEEILVDNERYFVGHSEYFLKIYVKLMENVKPNDIIKVKVVKVFKDGVWAEKV